MGVITASNSTRRTRFKKQKNSGHAKKALQEDYKFSQNRKNKGLEAQRQPSVQPNTAKVTPVPRVQSEQEALPRVTKCKRISLTGNQASQISSKRANLSLNLSTCFPNEPTQPTMQETVFGTSASLTWGAEGISFPMEEEFQLSLMNKETMEKNNSTPCTMGVENTLSTGKSLYRDFNTLTSALNTPDITDLNFEEKFEDFFKINDLGTAAMETNEPTMNEPTKIETDFSLPEEIWGFNTFNDDDFGICAPPSIVEGTVENTNTEVILLNFGETMEQLVEGVPEQTFDIETNDVLKWIIDDQQIGDLPIFDHSQPEETSDLHNLPVNIPEISQFTKVEIKTEDLGEDEKYRKMRSQNNEASRKCRMNRKRKQQDMEEEVDLLQERNAFLKSRMEEMEQEVKLWKKKLLSDIKNTSAITLRF